MDTTAALQHPQRSISVIISWGLPFPVVSHFQSFITTNTRTEKSCSQPGSALHHLNVYKWRALGSQPLHHTPHFAHSVTPIAHSDHHQIWKTSPTNPLHTTHPSYPQSPAQFHKLNIPNLVMSSAETATALAEALRRLSNKCYDMQDENVVEQETEKVPTEEEVKTHKDLFNQVKTTLLPDVRSLLTHLQMALDLFPESAEPKPKLNEALDVVSRLNTALNTLSISVCTLSPTIYSLGRKSSRIDQTYGVLKRFRCYILEMDVTELISQDLPELFLELSQFVSSGEYAQGGSEFSDEEYASKLLSRRTQLFATIDKIQSAIDTSLRLMDRSDFGILRHIWTEFDTELGDSLAQIAQRIHESKDLEVPPADHPFNLRPRIIHLLEQIFPLVKLARVFY
ncbi:hypothetical protein PGT21_034293 [Puccinia graminis f. sp. tritici]|uniref:Uncharacterized protein n=1 Tax=Puccinia graminis f. sp. tritici TaxID=56615 RepID=A0A5B0QCD2_PUCGR|nr:hypothetical protein PGT21_034293 [Puccinia graminis f. sp. tritici]